MFQLPDWTFEFHGHRCPMMPVGYRAGLIAMQILGVEHEQDHGLFAFSEMGEGHVNTCFEDGIQAATGATYGKRLFRNLYYGKVALVLYHPEQGAVRVSVKPQVFPQIRQFEFVKQRMSGVEPSQISDEVSNEIVNWALSLSDDDLFKIERLDDFEFTPPRPVFPMTKCSVCGEMVFDPYIRLVNGEPTCIPCCGWGA